jgi:uncharacterized membrane protein
MSGVTFTALTPVYLLIGLVLAFVAIRCLHDGRDARRYSRATFWGLLALAVLLGDLLPAAVVGSMVVVLGLIAGLGGLKRTPASESIKATEPADRGDFGNRLFAPVLAIPLVTVVLVAVGKRVEIGGKPWLSAQEVTLIALAIACVVALVLACRVVRESPVIALDAGGRMLESIGWAAVLPLVLAVLGGLFTAAGVGDTIAGLVSAVVSVDSRFACVLAYCLGMAAFTMIMGNAFAAFPVITAGIGLPLLVGIHGASPAPMAAIGMLSGYCGTLMTPMAANFNIVPAALLELSDPYAVIKAQAPTGVVVLAINIALMMVLVFPAG